MVCWRWWLVPAVAVGALALGVGLALNSGPYGQKASAADGEDPETAEPAVVVETVLPTEGGIERVTVQPGTLQAFESAALYTEVSGYLKTQTVDIGSRVQKGQVLATLDVPDLEKLVE